MEANNTGGQSSRRAVVPSDDDDDDDDDIPSGMSTANNSFCFLTLNVLFCFLASNVSFTGSHPICSVVSLMVCSTAFSFPKCPLLSRFWCVLLLYSSDISCFLFLIHPLPMCPFASFRRLNQTTHSLMALRIL